MLYVVTAVHNRYQITKQFVERLCQQTYKDISLVLVDDGSTDGTADMVKALIPNAVVLQGDGNLWWGGALHLAYKWIKKNASCSDYVWIANDDTAFSDDYCASALTILKSRDDILLTGYGISKQTGKQVDGAVNFIFPECAGYRNENTKAYENCASTRSLFLKVSHCIKVGGFHPVLLPHYGSDYEWTIRACRKNKIKVYCTNELMYEANEETTGYHDPKTQSIKKIFSKKSMSNPFYKMNFALLAAPWGKKIASMLCTLTRISKKIRKRP